MESIQIKNLRSLEDTGEMHLGKLNLLVGKNSSGKSTFLRFFPLLKQTVEARTFEPILWYGGNKGYVDFGDFEESITLKNKEKGEMEFTFKFDIDVNGKFEYFSFRKQVAEKIVPIILSIRVKKEFIKNIKIRLYDHDVEFKFGSAKNSIFLEELVVNGESRQIKDYDLDIEDMEFIPWINLRTFNIKNGKLKIDQHKLIDDIESDAIKILTKIADSRIKRETLKNYVSNIKIDSSSEMLNRLKSENTLKSIYNHFNNANVDDPIFNELKNKVVQIISLVLLFGISRTLEEFFENVQYIAPLRAVAERYYRKSGISVSEIDPKGENIPMYLTYLKDNNKLDLFNEWARDNFDMTFEISPGKGHASIKVYDSELGQHVNLADTGFGYSQILPIMVVLWRTIMSSRQTGRDEYLINSSKNAIIVMEQPELHLHPAMQALLIKSIIKIINVAKTNKLDFKFILETHSETIVNMVGYLIFKNKIMSDEVKVHLFEKENGVSKIRESTYNGEGYLEHWPVGFFVPDLE